MKRIDPSRTDAAYWAEILKSLELGMNSGTAQIPPTQEELEELEHEKKNISRKEREFKNKKSWPTEKED